MFLASFILLSFSKKLSRMENSYIKLYIPISGHAITLKTSTHLWQYLFLYTMHYLPIMACQSSPQTQCETQWLWYCQEKHCEQCFSEWHWWMSAAAQRKIGSAGLQVFSHLNKIGSNPKSSIFVFEIYIYFR